MPLVSGSHRVSLVAINQRAGWEGIVWRCDIDLQTIVGWIFGFGAGADKDSAVRFWTGFEFKQQLKIIELRRRPEQPNLAAGNTDLSITHLPVSFRLGLPSIQRPPVEQRQPTFLDLVAS